MASRCMACGGSWAQPQKGHDYCLDCIESGQAAYDFYDRKHQRGGMAAMYDFRDLMGYIDAMRTSKYPRQINQ